MSNDYDIAVIGAGVVGSAIARAFAGTKYSVALVDSREDVVEGTSKANTALLHTGYDASPGTLEAQLVARGYHLTREYCAEAGVGVDTTGAILVAWDDEQAESLPSLKEKAEKNGYTETYIISPEEVYEQIPDLGPGATGGLVVPGESVIDAWSVPIGYATDAVCRGAKLLLNHKVLSIDVGSEYTKLETTQGPLRARWVVNAAGLGSDGVDAMFGYDRLKVHPRRGELLVFDKLSRPLTDKIILAAPSKAGKGVLISPTAFGNLMLGPTSEDMTDKTDTSTTEEGFEFLYEKGSRIMPKLLKEEVTAAYAGLRAANNQKDYLIEVDDSKRYIIAAAIRSTGLTSALAVAEYVFSLMEKSGLDLTMREDLPPTYKMPPLAESLTRPFEDDEKIACDSQYGEVVCFCERVTRGELRDAFQPPIPPTTLFGLRRRTRAMNGRCQGFFCGAKVQAIFDELAGGNNE